MLYIFQSHKKTPQKQMETRDNIGEIDTLQKLEAKV